MIPESHTTSSSVTRAGQNSAIFLPFGIAVFPVLFLYAHNADEMPLGDIVWPLGIVVCFAAISLIILRFFVRDFAKRALVVSLFALLFFSFGHVVSLSRSWGQQLGFAMGGTESYVFAFWCIFLFAGTYLIIRTYRHLSKLISIASLVVWLMVGMQIVQGGYVLASAVSIDDTRLDLIGRPAVNNPPDIYYVIVDGYGRQDILQDLYDYDNGPFIRFLRQHGFLVPDSSRSNYCQTLLSLTSSLNLDYLSRLARFDRFSKDRNQMAHYLKNNLLFDFLKNYGYDIIILSSGYTWTEFNKEERILSPGMTLSEFDNILLATTPVPFVMSYNKSQYDLKRDQVTFMLNKLPRITEGSAPRFVFAHIFAPHPPFVFGAHGERLEHTRGYRIGDGSDFFKEGGSHAEYINGYRDQVAYLNGQLEPMITGILDRYGDNPPIIILQGDHGPGSELDWYSLPNTNIRERFSILNALYLPGVADSLVYDKITPVNTFRIILNEYFGSDLPLLPDSCFYAIITRPYYFFDVTDPDNPAEFPGDLR